MKSKNFKKVLITQHEENCYVIISPMAQPQPTILGVDYVISFFYDAGSIGAEWEPRHGPIQIFHKADADQENAMKHYFYDYVINEPMGWSQLAVEREGLPGYFKDGDYDAIFDILKSWASREGE